MPEINIPARRMGNNVVTELTDSVGTSEVSYNLTKPQDTLTIQNLGAVDLIVSVGNQTNIEVKAFKETMFTTESFKSFKIKTLTNHGSFRASASYKDVDEGDENDLSKAIKSLSKDQLIRRLHSGDVVKIKLIGDSITEGVGAVGHVSPPANTQPKIFDDGAGIVFYEGDYVSRCWANFFREYIAASFPSVQFTNAGIGGKSAKWANTNKQYWVANSEDVVFVMLGTNDRFDSLNAAEFETNLTSFLSYVNARCNTMVVMTATPTLNDYDSAGVLNPSYKFDMGVVDRVITKVCAQNGYIHISNYRKLLDYARKSKTPLNTLVENNGGSHPVDKGYYVMWDGIQQQLGLIDSIKNWKDLRDKSTIHLTATDLSTTTPVTSPLFGVLGNVYYSEIGNTHPDLANFPLAAPGLLITYKGNDNDLYSWQQYIIRGSTQQFMRAWDFAGSVWKAWIEISATWANITNSSTISTTTPITHSMFTAGKFYFVDIPSTHTDIATFPEGSTGTFVTYKAKAGDLWSYQEYHIRNTNRIYRRVWDITNLIWKAWEHITPYKKTATLDFPSIPANSTAELNVVFNGAVIGDSASATPLDSTTPGTPIENGLIWSAYVKTANNVAVRVANVTIAAIDPVSRTWKVEWEK